MKTIPQFLMAAAIGVIGAIPAQAQTAPGHGHLAAAPAASMATTGMAEGEVRKIDQGSGKITLKHGPIKSLDMPSMTMAYRVANAALLDKVKLGDKVASPGGKLTVTEIRQLP